MPISRDEYEALAGGGIGIVKRRAHGRPPHKHYQFAAKINWLHFTMNGAIMNLRRAATQIANDSSMAELNIGKQVHLERLLREVLRAVSELEFSQREVAEFNKLPDKYKV